MSRAAQTHLAGHMQPTGRVFETPDLDNVVLLNFFNFLNKNFKFLTSLHVETYFELSKLRLKIKNLKIYLNKLIQGTTF